MHDRALAAAAASHDNENLAAFDRECEILLDHVVTVGQGEISYGNMRIFIRHSFFLLAETWYGESIYNLIANLTKGYLRPNSGTKTEQTLRLQ